MTPARHRLAIAFAALVPLVAYPLVVRASGPSTFPGDRAECARVASGRDGEGLEVVAGHLETVAAAQALLARLAASGYGSMHVEQDGCGRWKVTRDGIESSAEGHALVDELGRAGFRARLELDPTPSPDG